MDKKPLDRVAKDGPKAIVLRKQLNKIGKSDKGEGAGQQAVIEQEVKTTGEAGGLIRPCKGLLPAAPKDAGFHAVQAQCPCRLGYPLKGS